jgi:hypothetical protein
MNPRRVRSSAWIVGLAAALAWAAPASSQSLETVRERLDLSPDPILRSPRLLGMGHLTLADDVNNRINLWDFARVPAGLLDADSSSILEFRPGTSSASSAHDDLLGDPNRERQDLAARDVRLGFEAWRRAESVAYGFSGDVSSLRFDEPRSDQFERRAQIRQPSVTGVLNGAIPRLWPERLRWAAHFGYTNENHQDQFRLLYRTPIGDYIDNNGTIIDPPDQFTPNDIEISTLGGGGSLAYRAGKALAVAALADFSFAKFNGENSGPRHSSEVSENRPYLTGQAVATGRLADRVEWGVDARSWTSSAQQNWALSLSTGSGAIPFSGRGKLAERDEKGSRLRTRARWMLGGLELGGSFGTFYRKIDITPPAADDRTSFNYFRNIAGNVAGTDSLVFPDSVSRFTTEERAWEGVAGGSWRVSRLMLGAEFHVAERSLEQTVTGKGPVRHVWDVRGGLEHPCTKVLTGRLGYIYRSDDRDDQTAQNEFVSHTVTAGLGLRPEGATWGFEAGYAIEWLQPDFGDPTEGRESRQQLAGQVRWVF